MKIKVLVDNNTFIDQYYCGEPAVSYYIEDEDIKLIFDVGYSNLFIENAEKFNININNIDNIIISHGHDDHTGGLKYYFENFPNNEVNIIAHPEAFNKKFIKDLDICSPILLDELKLKSNLILTKEPLKISDRLIFLGEIPKSNDFENRNVIGKQKMDNSISDDYVMDDSALVYQNSNGIFIITGCSHSGICNIIEYAKKICNKTNVLGVVGGFHLFEINDRVLKTIDYFNKNNIKNLYPCHCTSFLVKAEIHKNIPIKEVGVGLEIEIE